MTRKTTTVMLETGQCLGSTARTIEKALSEIPGVLRAYVNPATEAAYVEYDGDRCTPSDLDDAVRSVGAHALHATFRRAPTAPPFTFPSERYHMRETIARSRTWWAFAGFIVIAGFFLVTEHRAHLFGILPFLFLLACPFLHFSHSGHGRHAGHGGRAASAQEGDIRDREQAGRAGNDEQSSRAHQHVYGATGANWRSPQ